MKVFLKIRYYKCCRIVRTDTSEGIDPTKSNRSKECMICHHWFFNHEFKFQDSVCKGCHYLTMLSVNISDIAIITIKNVDYCCISKSEAINLLKNSWVYIKKYCLKFQSTQSSFFYFFKFVIYKMVGS